MLSALLRAEPSANVVVMMDSPAGTVNAAATPLTKRSAMIASGLFSVALTTEASPKTATAVRKTCRRPRRSADRPPRSSSPPYPST